MASINLQSSFKVDYFSFFTVKEFKEMFLAGLPLPNSITDSVLQFHLDSAISELESFLNLKFRKTLVVENKDFHRDDWVDWGFIKSTFPVVSPLNLFGYLGTTKQISYPSTWLSNRETNDGKNYSRMIYLVPNRNSTHSEAIIFSGVVPHGRFFNSKKIPDYWSLEYLTGWFNPPKELIDLVGKLTAFKVLQIISDALMSGTLQQIVDSNGKPGFSTSGNFTGLGLGISSKSISIDGLSQSYSSYANGTTGLYGARLKQYNDELDYNKPGSTIRRIYDMYGAVVMGVC